MTRLPIGWPGVRPRGSGSSTRPTLRRISTVVIDASAASLALVVRIVTVARDLVLLSSMQRVPSRRVSTNLPVSVQRRRMGAG